MSFSIRRGDIFYVHKFGIQVGSEEHTGRPGVVVSCDEGNRYSETRAGGLLHDAAEEQSADPR